MKRYESLLAVNNARAKYYPSFHQRVTANTRRLLKPDADQKLITKLTADIQFLAYKFSAVFDSSKSYFIILDRKMNIVDYNKASLRLVKKLFGKKMVIGEHILNFLHPGSAKTILSGCDKALNGETVSLERSIACLDNKTSWWSFEFSPAMDLKENITGLVFNAIDITKRKANEAKVLSQRKILAKISQIQSHEIRGPVCTIMGLMSLIKESDYEPNREYLLLLETTADILNENIREIVGLANDEQNNTAIKHT